MHFHSFTGNVQIEGKDFFSPVNAWASRSSNHLSATVLHAVLVDLKRHSQANFVKCSPTVHSHVAMKYVIDDVERTRFVAQQLSSDQSASSFPTCSLAKSLDKATQTERYTTKRTWRPDFSSKLEEARSQAKKKREEKLKEARSILDSTKLEENLSNCTIKSPPPPS